MELIPVNNNNKDCYNDFVSQHPEANIYSTLLWGELIYSTYGYTPNNYLVIDNGKPVACFNLFEQSFLGRVKRFSQVPFSHNVPFLVDDRYDKEALINFISNHFDNAALVFKTDLVIENSEIQKRSFNYISKLQLSDEATLWKGFNKSNVQRSLKKADKSELRLDDSNTLESYLTFYHLQALTRKKQGSPMYPRALFVNMYALLASASLAKCFLARDSLGEPIAGIITLSFNGKTIYAYGGSSDSVENLAKRPNHFLMWHAIRSALNSGNQVFDFGSTPLTHHSLLRYKSYWGAQTEELVYSYINMDEIRTINREGKLAIIASSLFQVMPVWLNKKVGPVLLKYIG